MHYLLRDDPQNCDLFAPFNVLPPPAPTPQREHRQREREREHPDAEVDHRNSPSAKLEDAATPAANSSRTQSSRPRASRNSRASACDPHDARNLTSTCTAFLRGPHVPSRHGRRLRRWQSRRSRPHSTRQTGGLPPHASRAGSLCPLARVISPGWCWPD